MTAEIKRNMFFSRPHCGTRRRTVLCKISLLCCFSATYPHQIESQGPRISCLCPPSQQSLAVATCTVIDSVGSKNSCCRSPVNNKQREWKWHFYCLTAAIWAGLPQYALSLSNMAGTQNSVVQPNRTQPRDDEDTRSDSHGTVESNLSAWSGTSQASENDSNWNDVLQRRRPREHGEESLHISSTRLRQKTVMKFYGCRDNEGWIEGRYKQLKPEWVILKCVIDVGKVSQV